MEKEVKIRFPKILHLRINRDLLDRLDFLLKQFPEDYITYSSIIRASIINLYNKKKEKLENGITKRN
jgi:hypothetical protein